jgi:uncharacterized membrane protein
MQSDDGDYTRLAALSDGLFAIVLTLLVLDLRLPELASPVTDAGLAQQFTGLAPRLFSYTLTFLVAGVFWASHHRDFEFIVRFARGLLWMNLMFLFSVSVLPFTTNLVGSHLSALTWALYALDVALGGLSLTAIWGYATASGLLAPEARAPFVNYMLWRHLLTPLVFLVSIAIGLFNAALASWAPILLPPLFILLRLLHPAGRLAVRPRPASAAARFWQLLAYAPLILVALAVILLLNQPSAGR